MKETAAPYEGSTSSVQGDRAPLKGSLKGSKRDL